MFLKLEEGPRPAEAVDKEAKMDVMKGVIYAADTQREKNKTRNNKNRRTEKRH